MLMFDAAFEKTSTFVDVDALSGQHEMCVKSNKCSTVTKRRAHEVREPRKSAPNATTWEVCQMQHLHAHAHLSAILGMFGEFGVSPKF